MKMTCQLSLIKVYSLFYYAVLLIILYSCQNEDSPQPEECESVNESQLSQTQNAFLDICFGNEFGEEYERIRKWKQDIKIYLPNSGFPSLERELDIVIEEINGLSGTVQLERVSDSATANFLFFFGTKVEYAEVYEPAASDLISTNRGLFALRWNTQTYEIVSGSACVDVVNETDTACLKHLLREEMTQSLGMMNDVSMDERSIFFDEYRCGDAFTSLDEQFIQDFLSPQIENGMCKQEVITEIF